MSKKITLIIFPIIIIMFPCFSWADYEEIEYSDIYRYKNSSEYIYSYSTTDSYNDNAMVAWVALDKNKYLKKIFINNIASNYTKEITLTSDVVFDPRDGNKLKLSDNWLVISFKSTDLNSNSLIVFDIGQDNPKPVYQLNNLTGGLFDIYGHILVFPQYTIRGEPSDLYVVDLQANNKITNITSEDECSYYEPSIYKNKIITTRSCSNQRELVISDIDKIKWESVSIDNKGFVIINPQLSDNYITYALFNPVSFIEEEDYYYSYNLKTKENKLLFKYSTYNEIAGSYLRGDKIIIALGNYFYSNKDKSRTWDIKLFDLSNNKDYSFGEKFYKLEYPSLSKDNLFWITTKYNSNGELSFMDYVDFTDTLTIDREINIKKDNQLINSLKGKIIILVEKKGQAFYVKPAPRGDFYQMFFLGRPDDAFSIMREQGVGITNVDLEKIPVGLNNLTGPDADRDGLPDLFEDAIGTDKNNPDTDGDGFGDKKELNNNFNPKGSGDLNLDINFSEKQKGRILLQVENNGEAWYINPEDGKRYFLGRPVDAFNIMRNLGIGVSNNDFNNL